MKQFTKNLGSTSPRKIGISRLEYFLVQIFKGLLSAIELDVRGFLPLDVAAILKLSEN